MDPTTFPLFLPFHTTFTQRWDGESIEFKVLLLTRVDCLSIYNASILVPSWLPLDNFSFHAQWIVSFVLWRKKEFRSRYVNQTSEYFQVML